MKHFALIGLLLCVMPCIAQSNIVPQPPTGNPNGYWTTEEGRFSACNEQGLILWYSVITDSTVMIVGSNSNLETQYDETNYAYITADTIIVPATVSHNNVTYKVVQTHPYGVFNYISSLTTIYLPATIELIGDSMHYSEYFADNSANFGYCEDVDCNWSFTNIPNLKKVHIDPANTHYTSIDGVVYTKDLKNLVLYPPAREDEELILPEGCEHILRQAMYKCANIKRIELSNSLKSVGHWAAFLTPLESLTIKDSVEAIGFIAFGDRVKRLPHITIGTQLSILGFGGIPKSDTIVCRAQTPPAGVRDGYSIVDSASIVLVPRSSINAYKEAIGWRMTSNIYPIEPPVVSTEEGVTISWVQSFSATGYVWYLYKDEAHTQLAMSLAFDKDGRLQEITLNSPAPQRVEAEDVEEGNNEAERFAEYFSFTIKNLSANTNYYYLRQTLCQEEVIETEEGTFNTTPDTPTAIQGPTPSLPAIEGEDKVTKILQNGNIILLRNGKRYGICGEEHQ